MRDGADHLMTVEYDTKRMTTCPVRAVAQYIAEGIALEVHARNAGERTVFTMHSFRSGGALTLALAGEDLPTVMQRAFWKKPSTACRYLRLRKY